MAGYASSQTHNNTQKNKPRHKSWLELLAFIMGKDISELLGPYQPVNILKKPAATPIEKQYEAVIQKCKIANIKPWLEHFTLVSSIPSSERKNASVIVKINSSNNNFGTDITVTHHEVSSSLSKDTAAALHQTMQMAFLTQLNDEMLSQGITLSGTKEEQELLYAAATMFGFADKIDNPPANAEQFMAANKDGITQIWCQFMQDLNTPQKPAAQNTNSQTQKTQTAQQKLKKARNAIASRKQATAGKAAQTPPKTQATSKAKAIPAPETSPQTAKSRAPETSTEKTAEKHNEQQTREPQTSQKTAEASPKPITEPPEYKVIQNDEIHDHANVILDEHRIDPALYKDIRKQVASSGDARLKSISNQFNVSASKASAIGKAMDIENIT
jgi:outer membrane biosynthesis protein TonB